MSRIWSLTDSNELYGVKQWGAPYFFISDDGNIEVSPTGKGDPRINLKALIDDLRRRGIQPPIIVRFNDILTARVQYLANAFRTSIGNTITKPATNRHADQGQPATPCRRAACLSRCTLPAWAGSGFKARAPSRNDLAG